MSLNTDSEVLQAQWKSRSAILILGATTFSPASAQVAWAKSTWPTVYLGLGMKEEAIQHIQKAYEEGSYYMIYLKVDPCSTASARMRASQTSSATWATRCNFVEATVVQTNGRHQQEQVGKGATPPLLYQSGGALCLPSSCLVLSL